MKRSPEQWKDVLLSIYWDMEHGSTHPEKTLERIYKEGLEDAIRAITPQNPEARSPNAEIRNQCCSEIRQLMEP